MDENTPDGLRGPLRSLGHTVDSVGSLRLKGLENSRLYREVAAAYDLFFTKDRAFAARIRALRAPSPVKVVLTAITQRPESDFVAAFMEAFARTDWPSVSTPSEWPP